MAVFTGLTGSSLLLIHPFHTINSFDYIGTHESLVVFGYIFIHGTIDCISIHP